MGNDDDRSQNSGNGNDNYENEDSKSSSIQFMITNRMRRILQDDLGYLTNEIDTMDPQIAAIVIERQLNRPVAGMPSSWKRTLPVINKINFSEHSKKFFKSLKIGTEKIIRFTLNVAKFAVPISIGPLV